VDNKDLFEIIMPFFIGIFDSLNPYALTLFLIFSLWISFLGHNRKSVIYFSNLFILTVAGTLFVYIVGFFDKYLLALRAPLYLDILRYTLILVVLSLGIVNLCDWLRFNKSKDFKNVLIPVPIFISQKDKQISKSDLLLLSFLTIVIAFILSINLTFWPQSQSLYMIMASLIMSQRLDESFKYVSLYCLGYVFLLIIISLIWYCLCSSKMIEKFRAKVGLVKIISAALFLANGLGILIIVFKS